jgi:hypothetical protein
VWCAFFDNLEEKLLALSNSLLASGSAARLRLTNLLSAGSDFWNFGHEARIRAFLEHRVYDSTWFFRPAEKGGVTKEVICGTLNRVSQTCSKNPKINGRAKRVAQVAFNLGGAATRGTGYALECAAMLFARRSLPWARRHFPDSIGQFRLAFCPPRRARNPRFPRESANRTGQFTRELSPRIEFARGGRTATDGPAKGYDSAPKKPADKTRKTPSAKRCVRCVRARAGTIPVTGHRSPVTLPLARAPLPPASSRAAPPGCRGGRPPACRVVSESWPL